MELMGLIIGLVLFVVGIFVMRLLGAWILRIDEVITNLKSILFELIKSNAQKGIE